MQFAEGPAEPRPPEAVRFLSVAAEPYADRQRLKLTYQLTPFLKRPNVEIRLQNPQGLDRGSITIIGTMDARFTLTAHVRGGEPGDGRLTVISTLGYEDLPDVDRHQLRVDLPEQGADPAESTTAGQPPAREGQPPV